MATHKFKPKVWRKHIFALLLGARTILLQLLFTLLVILFGEHILEDILGISIDLLTELALTVVVCGVWTSLHLAGELTTKVDTKETDKTPLARRQALLAKLAAPVKLPFAVISAVFSVGMSVAIIASSLLRAEWIWLFIVSYYLFLLAWLVIKIIDWNNDRYILTEDRIIDITRLPLIYEQRTEAPLAMVQNATTSQHGLGVLFDYGNVQIETAGATRPVLFEMVWRPKLIQEAIFNQIDALAKKNRQRERETQAAQVQHWFEAYHTLTSGIRDIQYENAVDAGRPIRIRWIVQGPPGRRYRTWVAWDVVSRNDDGEYAYRTRPHDQPWYADENEADGSGFGIHHVRGIRPPREARAIYFRVVVWFEGERAAHSSPERSIAIREPVKA